MTQPYDCVISADSHVMEPTDLWMNTLGNKLGDRTPRLLDEYEGKKGRFFYTGGQVLIYGAGDADAQKIGMQSAGWNPEVRVDFQKKAGIVAEIMNATMMLLVMRHPDREACELSAQVFNDWLAGLSGFSCAGGHNG